MKNAPPVIVDTNVLVSALISPDKTAPPGRIVRAMLEAALVFVVSDDLLAEYRAVLDRPRLTQLHGLSASDLDELLLEITRNAVILPPVSTDPAPDPGDQHLWDLLAARGNLVLVTGDKRLFDSGMRTRILAPAAFLSRWLD